MCSKQNAFDFVTTGPGINAKYYKQWIQYLTYNYKEGHAGQQDFATDQRMVRYEMMWLALCSIKYFPFKFVNAFLLLI